MGGPGAGARGPFRASLGGLTRAKFRLAERFQASPFPGGFATITAAQVALLAAALRDDPPPDPNEDGAPKQKALKEQPRLTREAMLAVARAHDPNVRDLGE